MSARTRARELLGGRPFQSRAVTSGRVHATARPLHVGGTLIVVQTDLRDDADRLVAQTTQTQIVRTAKGGGNGAGGGNGGDRTTS